MQPEDQKKTPGRRAGSPELLRTASPTRDHTLRKVLTLWEYPTGSAEGLQDATAPLLLRTPQAPRWHGIQKLKRDAWILIQGFSLFRPTCQHLLLLSSEELRDAAELARAVISTGLDLLYFSQLLSPPPDRTNLLKYQPATRSNCQAKREASSKGEEGKTRRRCQLLGAETPSSIFPLPAGRWFSAGLAPRRSSLRC